MTKPRRAAPVRAAAAASLQRTLGLYAVFAISIGAMIGSGIFVLPGLAFEITGPSVVLAFFLAGIVILPAAASKSEMATAIPEAGGTYLYIDRAMGPLMGTIAGFGVWFSLVFKAAFALVGLGAYLSFFVEVPDRAVAAVLALALIGLNLLGVKQTARVQAVLVTAVLTILIVFAIAGLPEADPDAFDPFFADGLHGLLAATGVVFVSYAGVTKVASVAEEVRQPGRNIPTAILVSVLLMMIVYPAVVAVMVGVTPAVELVNTLTPMATAAEQFLGDVGVTVVAATAVIALISMANAGLIASARYPLAMARNALAPSWLQHISARSGTPVAGIIVTGIVLIVLVLFVPILELAKLASAFQLLVFAFVNLALIAFRESRLDWYQPTFHSPAYPWLQIFGIVAALLLLTQMGTLPFVGALGFIVAGVLWYRAFGQTRASRESATRDALRLRAENILVTRTQEAVDGRGRQHIFVPIRRPTRPARQQVLIRLALDLTASPGGKVHVLHFDTPLYGSAPTAAEMTYAGELGVELTVAEAGDVNARGAVHAYVENHDVDLLLADMPQELRATRTLVRDLRWLRDHVSCDSIFVRNRHLELVGTIVIMGTGGPFDPVKVGIGSAIAASEGSTIRFVHVASEDASEAQMALIEEYHERLGATLRVPWESRVEPAQNLIETITRLSRGANLVVLGAPSHRIHRFTDLADRIAESVDCPALLVHIPPAEGRSLLDRMLERITA